MDTFRTVKEISKGLLTEKKSKFISFAMPVQTVDDVKTEIEKYRKEYYDARHVCWAYMLGAERKEFRANDDGEPSGTAGKPILGQINSTASFIFIFCIFFCLCYYFCDVWKIPKKF